MLLHSSDSSFCCSNLYGTRCSGLWKIHTVEWLFAGVGSCRAILGIKPSAKDYKARRALGFGGIDDAEASRLGILQEAGYLSFDYSSLLYR